MKIALALLLSPSKLRISQRTPRYSQPGKTTMVSRGRFCVLLLPVLLPAFGLAQRIIPVRASPVFDVSFYGAKGDNMTINTAAFRKAAAAAAVAAASGGTATVVVRHGSSGLATFLTGAFNLSSGVTLDISANVTVRGAADPEQFPVIPPLPSYGKTRDTNVNGGTNRYQSLVLVVPGARNVRILGGGTLHGGGAWWWAARAAKKLSAGRPHLIEILNASDVEVADVRLVDSPFWTLHPVYSRRIHIHDLTISAPADSPNTDGIDPDSSADVLIERCTISGGDDHIAIKSGIDSFGRAVGIPSTNITIRGNVHLAGRGISIGSEVSGGVERVLIEDVQHLGPSEHGLHIKTSATRGGYIRSVTYRNITVGNILADNVISVTTSYGSSIDGTPVNTGPVGKSAIAQLTDIRNIHYANISRGDGKNVHDTGAGSWQCFGMAPCRNVTLRDVHLDPTSGGWRCSHVHNPDAGSSKPVNDVSPPGLSRCFGSSVF